MDLAFGFIESCCRCTLISPEPEVNGRARTHTEGTCCKQVFSGASTEPATHALARTENMIASSWLIICVIFKLEITQLEMGFYFYLCALLEPFICTRTHFDTHTNMKFILYITTSPKHLVPHGEQTFAAEAMTSYVLWTSSLILFAYFSSYTCLVFGSARSL
jgi:hypothetical protein